MLRAATGLARDAAESVTAAAVELITPDNRASDPTATAGSTFAQVLEAQTAERGASVQELRAKLTTAIESVLQQMDLPADPALTFVARDDGTLQLEGDHPRAAELESNLRDAVDVQSLTAELTKLSSGADRRLVIHQVAGA